MNLGPNDFAQLANTLKSVRPDDVGILEETAELKGCGANQPGGGGFRSGNTCGRGGGGGGKTGSATHGMLQLLGDSGGSASAGTISSHFPFAFDKRGTFQGLIDKGWVNQPGGARTSYQITKTGKKELESRGQYKPEHFGRNVTKLPWKS